MKNVPLEGHNTVTIAVQGIYKADLDLPSVVFK